MTEYSVTLTILNQRWTKNNIEGIQGICHDTYLQQEHTDRDSDAYIPSLSSSFCNPLGFIPQEGQIFKNMDLFALSKKNRSFHLIPEKSLLYECIYNMFLRQCILTACRRLKLLFFSISLKISGKNVALHGWKCWNFLIRAYLATISCRNVAMVIKNLS